MPNWNTKNFNLQKLWKIYSRKLVSTGKQCGWYSHCFRCKVIALSALEFTQNRNISRKGKGRIQAKTICLKHLSSIHQGKNSPIYFTGLYFTASTGTPSLHHINASNPLVLYIYSVAFAFTIT